MITRKENSTPNHPKSHAKITPEQSKSNRIKNVISSMLNTFDKKDITVKHEKFILAFRKTIEAQESITVCDYLSFDDCPKRTEQFLKKLSENLAETEQNYSVSKLGYILAKSLGCYDYENLQTQLFIYQSLIETPWKICNLRVVKPHMHKNRIGLGVEVPFRDINDHSRASDYREHHTCYAYIYDNDQQYNEYRIAIPFKALYRSESYRTFALSESDAIAWLLATCICDIGVDAWNAELNALNVRSKIGQHKEKWSNEKKRFLEQFLT